MVRLSGEHKQAVFAQRLLLKPDRSLYFDPFDQCYQLKRRALSAKRSSL